MNESISDASLVAQKHDFDSNLKILLVEDLDMNRTLFIKFLERKGLSCDVVQNGEEAVRACNKKNYDIIFMDCQMPVMDGYEATRRIRASEGEKRHTIIIAMTAYAIKGDRERCLEAGMDDYMSKPFRLDELVVMLEKYGRSVSNEVIMVKAVFHIDDSSRWSLLLGNVKNLTHAVKSNTWNIEVLANSEAVKLYADTSESGNLRLMENLSQAGVRFVACSNSLNGLGIQRKMLPEFVDIVPVGVLELIERQAEGYAYIKP